MTDREQFPVAVSGIIVWAEERQTFWVPDTRATTKENQFFAANSSSMDVG
jgi:hypothetical protein